MTRNRTIILVALIAWVVGALAIVLFSNSNESYPIVRFVLPDNYRGPVRVARLSTATNEQFRTEPGLTLIFIDDHGNGAVPTFAPFETWHLVEAESRSGAPLEVAGRVDSLVERVMFRQMGIGGNQEERIKYAFFGTFDELDTWRNEGSPVPRPNRSKVP